MLGGARILKLISNVKVRFLETPLCYQIFNSNVCRVKKCSKTNIFQTFKVTRPKSSFPSQPDFKISNSILFTFHTFPLINYFFTRSGEPFWFQRIISKLLFGKNSTFAFYFPFLPHIHIFLSSFHGSHFIFTCRLFLPFLTRSLYQTPGRTDP